MSSELSLDSCRRVEEEGARKDLEEEVEAEQSAAGDDGEPGGVSTRDGLGHVRPVLERGDRAGGREGGRTETDETEDLPAGRVQHLGDNLTGSR